MFKDNNKRVNELIEEFELETYDMVAVPPFETDYELLLHNSKVLDSILGELLIEERNHKIDTLTQQDDNYEQDKSRASSRNRRRNR